MKGSTNTIPIGDETLSAYFGNYMMKLNLRLGNSTHTVARDCFPHVSRSDGVLDCMMLGADVTHPTGGSAKGTPSIAAVVGSIDDKFGVFLGSMRYHTARQEWIEDMEDMVYQCLTRWHEKNNDLPRRILYYRDGVDESYYSRIRTTELRAIRAAYTKIWPQKKGAEPEPTLEITAVICAKRRNTRFYPKGKNQRTGRDGNCLPGTVVDSGITSPYYFDFFLQSHEPLKGSARPTHYFVLENGMCFSERDLQDLTNNLCYTYGRSTRPVSYAPPAYYADRLCERGRAYLRSFFDNHDVHSLTQHQVEAGVKACWDRNALTNGGNPWDQSLNNTMFWM